MSKETRQSEQPVNFRIGRNFTATTSDDVRRLTGRFFEPPDTMGAIGPNHFVELINGGFTIYNRAGRTVQRISDAQFWREVAGVDFRGIVFDPRIIYDAASQRWFAVEAANTETPRPVPEGSETDRLAAETNRENADRDGVRVLFAVSN